MLVRCAIVVSVILWGASANASPNAGVSRFVERHHLTRYTVAVADLNGDGRAEALLYATSTADDGNPNLCGSGGCVLYVLATDGSAYRQKGRIMLVRPPIRVLPTVTLGWHDLSVRVSGGGIRTSYEARVRFNGHRYLSNPTVQPAERLSGDPSGTMLTFLPNDGNMVQQ